MSEYTLHLGDGLEANRIEFGDCRETLRRWAAQGIKAQMCVTSPPYFGLRDYGTGTWEGGDPACTHTPSGIKADAKNPRAAAPNGKPSARDASIIRGECPCGARKVDRQLGLEQTPEEYITAMVEVFRCVRDVLADDGTVWLNIGDSYATDPKGPDGGKSSSGLSGGGDYQHEATPPGLGKWNYRQAGYKRKDLIGIPWMLAFALRADGWYLRQDIIWHKPNPMPESVRDRCTKAHEYVFLLSKSERYYFDSEAIKEPATSNASGAAASFKRSGSKREQTIPGQGYGTHRPDREDVAYNETRNKRSVWNVATRPYSGAHFATFPPALIEPCILAGSRPGDIVLDPFMGSGTTAAVALQHGRQYLGCELNEANDQLQQERIKAVTDALEAERANRTLDLFGAAP